MKPALPVLAWLTAPFDGWLTIENVKGSASGSLVHLVNVSVIAVSSSVLIGPSMILGASLMSGMKMNSLVLSSPGPVAGSSVNVSMSTLPMSTSRPKSLSIIFPSKESKTVSAKKPESPKPLPAAHCERLYAGGFHPRRLPHPRRGRTRSQLGERAALFGIQLDLQFFDQFALAVIVEFFDFVVHHPRVDRLVPIIEGIEAE